MAYPGPGPIFSRQAGPAFPSKELPTKPRYLWPHASLTSPSTPTFSHSWRWVFLLPPLLSQNQCLYMDIYLLLSSFLGNWTVIRGSKSFHTGPCVPYSTISGYILVWFALQYIPNLLVAPESHILTYICFWLKKKKERSVPSPTSKITAKKHNTCHFYLSLQFENKFIENVKEKAEMCETASKMIPPGLLSNLNQFGWLRTIIVSHWALSDPNPANVLSTNVSTEALSKWRVMKVKSLWYPTFYTPMD